MIDYILFVGQEANFQSRIILIPKNIFLQTRQKDYDILKTHVNCDTSFAKNCNYLKSSWEQNGNCASQIKHDYTDICNLLNHYASYGRYIYEDDREWYSVDDSDIEWYNQSIFFPNDGFDHVSNYNKFKNMKEYDGQQINVVDSFLYMEDPNENKKRTKEAIEFLKNMKKNK